MEQKDKRSLNSRIAYLLSWDISLLLSLELLLLGPSEPSWNLHHQLSGLSTTPLAFLGLQHVSFSVHNPISQS